MNDKLGQVTKKEVADIKIAGYRFKARFDQVGEGFGRVGQTAADAICGPSFVLYHSEPDEQGLVDMEACMPVSRDVSAEDIHTRLLKGGTMITVLHHGAYDTIAETYSLFMAYLGQNAITPMGVFREVYLECEQMHGDDSSKYVTEIQVPIG